MNTPAHLLFGLTAFGTADSRRITAAAFGGALLPDLSLYVMAGWHLFVVQTPAQVVFGEMYYSEAWQSIFRIDNSIVLWALGFMVATILKSRIGFALCGAALLHLFLDFPLHNDDARAHFWPITDWKFISPVSYWDSRYYGHIVGPLEVIAASICTIILWRRYVGLWMRSLIVAVMALELAPSIIFGLMFAGHMP